METSSSCGSGCGCGGVSRREVLAVGLAAAVVVPLVGSGDVRGGMVAVDEGTWTATVKAADLVDKQGTAVEGQPLMLSREGKKVFALSTKCTHKGCTLKPKEGTDVYTCQCHKAQFDLEGNVAHVPAKLPLPRYALRLNKEGVIEVDMSKTVEHDAVEGVLTLS